MAFAAELLLVFSLVLIAIGVVATLRLRRHGRAVAPAPQPAQPDRHKYGQRTAEPRQSAPPAGPAGEYAPAPGGGYDADDYAAPGAHDGPGARGSTTLYPGGMDAEAAEIEQLKAEIAALKAHGGDAGGFKRTQTLVAVAANVSGVLGLFVSVAALLK